MRPDQYSREIAPDGRWSRATADRVAAPERGEALGTLGAGQVDHAGRFAAPAPVETAPDRASAKPDAGGLGGPDGEQIAGGVSGHLEYLSWISRELGVPDPVAEYFGPVVGRWTDMHEQADRWRRAAGLVDDVAVDVASPLGGMDESWTGADAESFRAHIDQFGLATTSLSETMVALAEALDATADGIRALVMDMVEILAHGAESVSEAMVLPLEGEQRARNFLREMQGPVVEMFELVREVLQALVSACEGFEGQNAFSDIEMAHTYPGEDWSFEMPATGGGPAPETAPAGVGGGGAGGGGAGGGGAGVGGGGVGVGGGAGIGGAGGAPSGPAAPVSSGATTGIAAATGGTPPSSVVGGAGGGAGGGGMMGGMMGGGGMGGGAQQNEDKERKKSSRVISDATELFGEPEATVAPVIGADDDLR
ncbi:uncharacterized protein YukE [Actinoalloteichus hoggarensis]|uniref:Outer membrane channel protein CpnT-like N-terminal domain-containing protein n=1 Tax=Actinoalloteichus hoggarensis TaxID=1470176 RepID=A0A221W9U8_9PSEU|nr:hypothetical protein [Actinoalloteichus hoggarensis]ASO22780.1 hypothetical protein AHOG_25875 [Actinoalloteichus hoggarensis]MBB5924078.1 uncharacterized protein YukE [Actinoalloteichus hoggarensis]